MKFNLYFFILAGMLFMLYKGMVLSLKAPRKLKIAGVVVCILGFLRYSALIFLYVAGNIEFLYLLKPAVFLQYIYIPVIGVCTFNIYMKRSKLSYVFSVLSLSSVLYFVLMIKLGICIKYLQGSGYVMSFQWIYFPYITYLVFNTIILIGTFMLFRKNIILIRLSAFVSILEIIMAYFGVNILPYLILGDLIWLFTFVYSLNKVKKQT